MMTILTYLNSKGLKEIIDDIFDNEINDPTYEYNGDDDDDDSPLTEVRKRYNKSKEIKQSNFTNIENFTHIVENTDNPDNLEHPKPGEGRKRVRDKCNWKRNLAKRAKNEGKSYLSLSTGKQIGARLMKSGCGEKCRYKCHCKFSQAQRESIFHSYWQLGNVTKQWQFLNNYASYKPKLSSNSKSTGQVNRQFRIVWSLPSQSNEQIQVCKTFFLHTLSVSERMVSTAFKKQVATVGVRADDQRGKHDNRHNKTPEHRLDTVRTHIESFPYIDSHYCRRDSTKSYLPAGLNVKKTQFH